MFVRNFRGERRGCSRKSPKPVPQYNPNLAGQSEAGYLQSKNIFIEECWPAPTSNLRSTTASRSRPNLPRRKADDGIAPLPSLVWSSEQQKMRNARQMLGSVCWRVVAGLNCSRLSARRKASSPRISAPAPLPGSTTNMAPQPFNGISAAGVVCNASNRSAWSMSGSLSGVRLIAFAYCRPQY